MSLLKSPSFLNPSLSTPHNTHRLTRNHRTTLTSIVRCSLPKPASDPITTLTRLLWGPSLPPALLISTVRFAWSSTWHLFMRQLAPSSSSGSYSRPASQFPSVPRYSHPLNLTLYASPTCPWAHRTLIALSLMKNGFKNCSIRVCLVSASEDGAWMLEEKGVRISLKEIYKRREGGYEGRATVPMLWDEDRREVLCNESYEIIRFFNEIGRDEGVDLMPEELEGEVRKWNEVVYPNINNGVYRCGFAQSQEAYDSAVNGLFNTMDTIDTHLSTSRYLCGETLTLADICLFTTLIRFDLVYNVLFKCTKKKLVEYSNLYAYTRDIYQIPNVAETCDFDAIRDGYYRILFPLNPGSILPSLPCACEEENLLKPHGRDSMLVNASFPVINFGELMRSTRLKTSPVNSHNSTN